MCLQPSLWLISIPHLGHPRTLGRLENVVPNIHSSPNRTILAALIVANQHSTIGAPSYRWNSRAVNPLPGATSPSRHPLHSQHVYLLGRLENVVPNIHSSPNWTIFATPRLSHMAMSIEQEKAADPLLLNSCCVHSCCCSCRLTLRADWKDPVTMPPLLCLILGVPRTSVADSKPVDRLGIHLFWTGTSFSLSPSSSSPRHGARPW